MNLALCAAAWCILAAEPAVSTNDTQPKAAKLEEQLQAVNLEEAQKWDMWLDASQQTKAELIEKPVYLWTNPTKNGGQYGSVFVWTHAGRPVVVGSIFAHPLKTVRRMTHEFHSLASSKLAATCSDPEGGDLWSPTAGLALQPLPGAPKPESTPAKRLIQMRTLGRQFGGHTVDWRKERWELRLLTQPIYRYEEPRGDLIDGALLALVTDAGTDPEVLLLLEAGQDGWHYALLRFSDSSLYVTRQDKEIWSAVRGVDGQQQLTNSDHTYQVFAKRMIELLPEEIKTP
jgi:hypothetical protein